MNLRTYTYTILPILSQILTHGKIALWVIVLARGRCHAPVALRMMAIVVESEAKTELSPWASWAGSPE